MLKVCAAALLLATCGLAVPARAATVSVVVTNVRPNGALVLASLCSGSLERSDCGFGQRQASNAPALRFTFTDVPPGRYAFLAFQDVNGTGTLERSRMGLPLVPYALSNNVGVTRRPTFEQAAFEVGPNGVALSVRLRQLRERVGAER